MTVPIQLPAGTDVTKAVNLPMCGSWSGQISVSLITLENCTIHELLFLYSTHADGKIRYRRLGNATNTDYSDWTLQADRKYIRWMISGESAAVIRYTSTKDISLFVETTRLVKPFSYPTVPVNPYPTEQLYTFTSSISPSYIFWKASA